LLTGVESGQARQPEIPSKIEGEQFMRVIVYSREEEPATGLARAIRALVQGVEVDICSSFLQCEETLSLSWIGEVVAVALVGNREELAGLLSFRERLMEIPLVLVLPDDNGDTVRLGHRLRPRFVGFFSSGFNDVASVVARLLERLEHAVSMRQAEHRAAHPEYVYAMNTIQSEQGGK